MTHTVLVRSIHSCVLDSAQVIHLEAEKSGLSQTDLVSD